MPKNVAPLPSLPYKPDDRVFPAVDDDDLWRCVQIVLLHEYGEERVRLEHARWAFDAVCDELDDYLAVDDFIRKVRLKWLWQRPPLPRGLVDF